MQEVVEVEDAPALFFSVVALPDLGDDNRVVLGRSATGSDCSRVVTGCEALSLRPFDLGGEISKRATVVTDVLASGRGQQARLGGDDDRRRSATFRSQPPEFPERNRMEGSSHRRLAETEARQAAPELRCGLASEGESQHVLCRGGAFVDPPRDATREHPRLAGARRGQHTQGLRLGRDRFALSRVASGQESPGQVARPRHARVHEQTVAVGCRSVQVCRGILASGPVRPARGRVSFCEMLTSFAGSRLFGESYGAGTPWVLALHGWRRNHRDFEAVLAAPGIDAIALDLPGFGSAAAPETAWGSSGLRRSGCCRARRDGAAGGRARAFLWRSCRGASGGKPSGPNCGPGVERRAASPAPGRPFQAGAAFPRWRARPRGAGLIGEDKMEGLRQRYGSDDYRTASGVMRGILVRVLAEDYVTVLARVKCPVELVWGDDDAVFPWRWPNSCNTS